jgi:CubicO group peptidase (beta-lactamase class C family)
MFANLNQEADMSDRFIAAARVLLLCVAMIALAAPLAAASDWQIVDKPVKGATPIKLWQKAASPEVMGWDSAKLKKLRAFSRRFGTGAFMIVQDGVVVDAWGSYKANLNCHSIRKSLMSALIGLYVKSGQIKLSSTMAELGINDNAGLTKEESQATVEMLLKARSGIYLPALGESLDMKLKRPKRGEFEPGKHWYYNNWDFNALGTIFRQETGQDIFAAFKSRIADPLGMQDFDPKMCESHKVHPRRPGFHSQHAYYLTRMSARDLARVGLLYMRGGKWNGKQIIPADWVAASLTPHSKVRPGTAYGYMWWLGNTRWLAPGTQELDEPYFMASGFRGQRLVILPQRKLVLVHRVDSDETPYSVNNTMLSRMTWMLLDAAGEKRLAEANFLEGAKGEMVHAGNIDHLLKQGMIAISTRDPGLMVQMLPGGVMNFLDPQTQQAKLVGAWHFEDKILVMNMPGQKERTMLVKLDSKAIRTFNMYGQLTDTFRIVQQQ